MGRLLDALFGDVQSTVRRDVDRVTREARALAPANRGRLAQSLTPNVTSETRNGMTIEYGAIHGDRYLFRRANGTPAMSWHASGTDKPVVEVPEEIHTEQLTRMKERWEHTCGGPGPLPIPLLVSAPFDDPDNPIVQLIREHAERAINGGHEWVEVELSGTEQVVAWYCSRCDEQRYAEGW